MGCGLLVGVADNRAVAVRGDPESPVSRGLACVKGYHAAEVLYGPDRLTRALVRRNRQLTPVPLSEALDLVARAIRDTIRGHGPDSVALYGSTQWALPDAEAARVLFRSGIGTRQVATAADLHAGAAKAGLARTFGLPGSVGCFEDLDYADLFVLWDLNLAETHPVLFTRMLERRRRDPGVRIVDLSTRTTRTSYAADQRFRFSPEAAMAVANGICREIIATGRVRRDFVDQHVAFRRVRGTDPATGEEVGWREYLAFLDPYRPGRVEERSGLAAAHLQWLASLYGDPARRVVTLWDPGVNAGGGGTAMHCLLYNIHLLVGKVAEPGNQPLCLTGSLGGDGPLAPDATSPGPSPLSLFQALERGEIRFLWIQATNPMLSLPNLARYRRAATREDCFIVVSEAYPTPTTDLADVVLPAALWLEREGLTESVERRVCHFPPVVSAPPEVLGDAQLMIEVARRLGHAEPNSAGVAPLWNAYRQARAGGAVSLPGLAQLRDGPGAHWPFTGGREVRWRYHPNHDPGASAARGRRDFYGHGDHRAWIWFGPDQPLPEPPDREFPLLLITGAVLEHTGGGAMTRRIPTLHRAVPAAYVEVSRQDARRLGLRNRETVRLVSRRGALDIEARIEYRSEPPPGQLFVPGFDEVHPVNRLTLDRADPDSGEPARACAVRLERLAAGRGP